MSPYFKIALVWLLLVALLQCGVARGEDEAESQKVWDCTEGRELITMHKKAALCAGGNCVWFDWHSTIVSEEMILFSYKHEGVYGLVISQDFPTNNTARVIVKDQSLGVAAVSCSYVQPTSASRGPPSESSPEG